MNITSWYKTHFESRLVGRYITLDRINLILDSYQNSVEISSAGTSELNQNIPLLKIGHGKKVVLGWSQMHGNESTTTKAIFDFIKFLTQTESFQKEIKEFLKTYSFFILPMLNPDGAKKYNRVNANDIDLNRDAQQLSQKESKVLRSVYNRIKPELCLNLHDQRSIYGLPHKLPATVSFLAPSADKNRTITKSRTIAMKHIERLNTLLQSLIPGQVGRYDDTFNADCVGDTFQQLGTPTILFEAGHFKNDYEREKTREFIFYAFVELFQVFAKCDADAISEAYSLIPENNSNFRDIILKNLQTTEYSGNIDIAIQFSEELIQGEIVFVPTIDRIGNCENLNGHKVVDLKGNTVLVNSQEKIYVGQKISSIVNKNDDLVIIL